MNTNILPLVQSYLDRAQRSAPGISDEVIEAFGEACKTVLRRTFNEGRNYQDFTLRLSNVGKPSCELQMAKKGAPAEENSYNHVMKMMLGDLVEALAIAVMKGAGVNVQEEQKSVVLELGEHKVNGTYDVKIDDEIWDIKSASPFVFKQKFSPETGSFKKVKEQDGFGYVGQGFAYGFADNSRFGGWIAIDKASGEWAIVDTPPAGHQYADELREALNKVKSNLDLIKDDTPFERCFEDIPETHRKRLTGNRYLGFECSWCPFKWACWPGLKHLPKLPSEAKNPGWEYYTHVDPDYASDASADKR